jgi:hypothetical protein
MPRSTLTIILAIFSMGCLDRGAQELGQLAEKVEAMESFIVLGLDENQDYLQQRSLAGSDPYFLAIKDWLIDSRSVWEEVQSTLQAPEVILQGDELSLWLSGETVILLLGERPYVYSGGRFPRP